MLLVLIVSTGKRWSKETLKWENVGQSHNEPPFLTLNTLTQFQHSINFPSKLLLKLKLTYLLLT